MKLPENTTDLPRHYYDLIGVGKYQITDGVGAIVPHCREAMAKAVIHEAQLAYPDRFAMLQAGEWRVVCRDQEGRALWHADVYDLLYPSAARGRPGL